MDINIDEEFIVSLKDIEYEGPLSVLFEMLKRSEKNIYEVSLLNIIEQFSEYLRVRASLDLDTTGDFILMAADFHVYKSRMLLPEDMTEENFTQHLEYKIVEQMLEFQKYKISSEALEAMQDQEGFIVERKDIDRVKFKNEEYSKDDNDMVWQDVKLYDLVYAFAKVLFVPEDNLAILSGAKNFHIDDAIEMVNLKIAESSMFPFISLFKNGITKRELVTFFLALLEMVKEKNILLKQDAKFQEIYIFKREENK